MSTRYDVCSSVNDCIGCKKMKCKRNVKSVFVFSLTTIGILTIVNTILLASRRSTDTVVPHKQYYNTRSEHISSFDSNAQPLRSNGLINGTEESSNLKTTNEEQNVYKVIAADKQMSQNEKENAEKLVETDEVKMTDAVVDGMIDKLTNKSGHSFFPNYFWNMTLDRLARTLGSTKRKTANTLSGYKSLPNSASLPHWKKVHRNIRQFSLYDPDDPNVVGLLNDLATLPIVAADESPSGTQLKIILKFSDGGRAVLKPMRYPREVETNANSYIFDDIERHYSEIAAFQLDRILGFYRIPPAIGRWVNITSELKPLVPMSILNTFYTSPAGNICFYGECSYFCDSAHAFCGKPDMIEASFMSYLPSRNIAPRIAWYQPYRRSYSKFSKAYWELNKDACQHVRKEAPFNNGKLLLDLTDVHAFDFLIGNKDRHSIAVFEEFGNYSFPIMYDNGRGFGRKTYDAISVLAPLQQCCVVRKSTLLKYLKIYIGPEKLSFLMEEALKSDPVAPVLLKGHLTALDRRLVKVLQVIAGCIETLSISNVVIDDGF